MKFNRPLLPRFLKQAENRLLSNNPSLWSARAHLVVYYGLLFIAVLAFLAYNAPDDARSVSSTEYWIGFVCIISILAMTVWLIYMLRFNVFKRFGTIGRFHVLAAFLLYFISTAIIVLFTYVHPVIESIRANQQYGDEEIVKDMNAVNIAVCKLEYDSLYHKWHTDTVIVDEKLSETMYYYGAHTRDVETMTVEVDEGPRVHNRIDTATLRIRLSEKDSTKRLNDSMYVFYEPPTYALVATYRPAYRNNEEVLSSKDLYDMVIRDFRPPADKKAVRDELNTLVSKYTVTKKRQDEYYRDNRNRLENIREKYRLYEVGTSINNIMTRKTRFEDGALPVHVRIVYYCTLVLTLLILAFRFSSKRTFFLSLLTVVILSILTALALAFFRQSEFSFFGLLILYTLIFLSISLTAWKNRSRKAVTGIAINLFVFMTPVFPLLLVNFYYEMQEQYLSFEQMAALADQKYRHLLYAEVAGGVLLLILLATYIQKVYRRWYALPRE